MSAAEVASGVRSAEDVIFCCLAPLAPKLAQGSGGRTAVIARCVESHLLIHSPSWGLETLDSARLATDLVVIFNADEKALVILGGISSSFGETPMKLKRG